MRQLPVDMTQLEIAMEMDPDSMIEGEQEPYLDVQTGEVVWVWESDEAFADTMNEPAESNARLREAVDADPDRFVFIEALDVADDNETLADFLGSDWTEDDALHRRASEAYTGSVGRWKRAIGHDAAILDAWRAYEDGAVRRRALALLAEHGIEPIPRGGMAG